MLLLLTALAALLLAFANGANDNMKGVATLLGAGVVDYRRAILLASIATAAGSLVSIFLAGSLIAAFSGKGIVPDVIAAAPGFVLAVSAAAAGTVMLATRLGLPISTTHALVGGLLGAGLAYAPEQLQLVTLGKTVLLPLLLSPLVAIALCFAVAPWVAHVASRAGRPEAAPCVCTEPAALTVEGVSTSAHLVVGRVGDAICTPAPARTRWVLSAAAAVDAAHTASATVVAFARGLNDTPKMAAILMVLGLGGASAALSIAVMMTLGGLLAARRVAKTMALEITTIAPAEGLGANLVTAGLVIAASRYGLPVSTTHVSCGALFGLAAAGGQGQLRTIAAIVAAWALTLPFSAATAALIALAWK